MARYLTPSGHVVLYDDGVILPGPLAVYTNGYAVINGAGKQQLLHRWLLGLVKGDKKIGDHINRNPLDCRLANLRIVTSSGNQLNRRQRERDLPTGVYHVRSGRFHAQVKRNGTTTHLGTYNTSVEAFRAYSAHLGKLALMGEVVATAYAMAA